MCANSTSSWLHPRKTPLRSWSASRTALGSRPSSALISRRPDLDLQAGTRKVENRCAFAHHELRKAREQADLLVGIEPAERRHQPVESLLLQPMLIQPMHKLFA